MNLQNKITALAVPVIIITLVYGSTLPAAGMTLPVTWGDLGDKLVTAGVIDPAKLAVTNDEKLVMNEKNAGYILNLFWALGLANKNPILEHGEMMDPRYGGPQNFASTGGWTIAMGRAMDHYSKHQFFTLTPEQQDLVDRISWDIYRPCCKNSAHFPDCNHGMAMLGLLELMASQGVGEPEMRATAATANTYWFPGLSQKPSGCSI